MHRQLLSATVLAGRGGEKGAASIDMMPVLQLIHAKGSVTIYIRNPS
jgi:hypothetical protein